MTALALKFFIGVYNTEAGVAYTAEDGSSVYTIETAGSVPAYMTATGAAYVTEDTAASYTPE
jgi:hypothetical protein